MPASIGLRVNETEDVQDLDTKEHGLAFAYADFMPVVPAVLGVKAGETAAKSGVSGMTVTNVVGSGQQKGAAAILPRRTRDGCVFPHGVL